MFEQLLARRAGLVVGGGIDELLVGGLLGDAADGDEGGRGASGEDLSEGGDFGEGNLRTVSIGQRRNMFCGSEKAYTALFNFPAKRLSDLADAVTGHAIDDVDVVRDDEDDAAAAAVFFLVHADET